MWLRAGRQAQGGKALDVLATRAGLSLALVVLLLVCLLAGLYVDRSIRQVEESRDVFSDRHIRNSYMSMGDTQRLLVIVQAAAKRGAFTPETERAFREAADYLYVRIEDFRQTVAEGLSPDSAGAALAAMDDLMALVDTASLRPEDVPALWAALADSSEAARRELTTYLEEMGREQNELMHAQYLAVKQQGAVVLASLAGLSCVGIAALMLFRREVLARTARERAEKHVEFLAYFDPLTGLPNRTQFQLRLADWLKRSDALTLALIDLDEFKGINDTYGHAAGDAVLRHVARLLAECAARLGGMAARLGGDEFALATNTTDAAPMLDALAQVLEDVRKGVTYEGEMFRISLSVGFADTSLLGDGLSPTVDTVFRVADFALYDSKSRGRGRITRYDRELERRLLDRRAMIDELPRAVLNGELEVYLQPKVRLPTGRVYGFEALVRWVRHGRMVGPDDFVRIAEESGLIYDIDHYVLRVATMELGRFNRAHGAAYSVSVNLSALHFSSDRAVGWVREALEASGLAPECLTIEITETAELRDWKNAQGVIAKLRKLGVRISIDDFGAGYSSLAYLRSAVIDELKIDRSIVDQIETSEEARFLLDGVLNIAGNLGLDVVVEGVESDLQSGALCAMGATRAQGYLFGRPGPAQAVLNGLAEGDRVLDHLPDLTPDSDPISPA